MNASGNEPTVSPAESPEDFEAFGNVCRAYVDWCRERYRDMPWFVEEVFGYQALEDELKGLAQKYGQPAGRTMLVRGDDGVVAGGAYRRLSDTVCELKRLYVANGAKGSGLGRKLSDALISAAIADGYAAMQLDTGNRLTEAISMYESMGFKHISPYQEYPARLMPYLVFMEKPLR
jgi:GNAT superfamily N-acetyltransferase